MSNPSPLIGKPDERLKSLDFLRGFIMVLLTLESTGLYSNLDKISPENPLITQFFHHPWNGLRFWDLVQPIFMFVAGTAMAFSLAKQKKVFTWGQSFAKTLRRSFWLFFWGVLDYAVRESGLSFELWDVLTQLAFTTLVAFLISNWPVVWQIAVSFLCLLLPELLYRYTNISGFDQPFTDQHNFGNYMDLVLMNKINRGGWVAINCISTSAHTIWGLLAGKLLLSAGPSSRKIRQLLISGIILMILGYGLDLAGITPIIKRIATSSFVLASGGWCLLFLAFCYWWIDVREHRRYIWFFTIVGMNSIFIYVFIEIVGSRFFNDYISAISGGLLAMINTPLLIAAVISSLVIFTLEWLILYFLYRKKIFFKL